MTFDKDTFIKKLISGEIRPSTVEKTVDKEGPIMMLNFPEFGVRVHIHFSDDEYEETGRAHIKDYEGNYLELLDARVVALIRMNLEEAEHRSDVLQSIDRHLVAIGFERTDLADNAFLKAYIIHRSRLTATMVFFVCDDYERIGSIEALVRHAREWNKKNLKASRLFKGVVFHIVVLHKGAIIEGSIKGVSDKTGIHSSLCRGVTAIDIYKKTILQDRFATGSLMNLSGKMSEAISRLGNLNFK